MIYELSALEEFDFGVRGIEAKKQTICFILATIQNTVVMDREAGWLPDVDAPNSYLKSTMSVKIIEAIERRVPGTTVESVSFKEDTLTGKLTPQVKVVIEND